MKLRDNTNKYNSIYHYTLGLLGLPSTDSTTLTSDEFVSSANTWIRNAGEKIWQNQNYWEWDDNNQTDVAEATTDLVANQQDYTLPNTIFDVMNIEVKDTDGNWAKLKPLTSEYNDDARQEFYETAGMPIYYKLRGNVLSLYPKPSSDDVTTTDGITLYVARDISPYTITSTSQAAEPGFPRQFHDYVAIGIAYDQSIKMGLNEKWQQMAMMLKTKEKDIKDHYSRRQKDIKTRIKPRVTQGSI